MLQGLIYESLRMMMQLRSLRTNASPGRRRRAKLQLATGLSPVCSVQSLEDRSLLSALPGFPAPTITSPGATTPQSQPVIQWTTVSDAVSYDLWINNDTSGVAAFHTASTAATSYTPPISFDIGQYSVWVRAEAAQGQKSNWTPRTRFRINTPAAIQPLASQQSTARPTVEWDSLPGAVRYDLWIDNVTTGQSQYVRLQNLTSTSFTQNSDMHLGTYRAWVRGIDASGNAATWSPAMQFSVMPAPGIPIPESSIFNPRPTFSWNPVAGAVRYELTLRDSNTGTVLHNPTIIGITNWRPPADLVQGPYRWTVTAVNPNGFRSLPTDQRNVWIGGRPEIVSPVSTVSTSKPTFVWKPVLDAVRYELYVSRIGGQGGVIQTPVTLNSYTSAVTLVPGQYRFWVRAVSVSGTDSPWSQPANFTIV